MPTSLSIKDGLGQELVTDKQGTRRKACPLFVQNGSFLPRHPEYIQFQIKEKVKAARLKRRRRTRAFIEEPITKPT